MRRWLAGCLVGLMTLMAGCAPGAAGLPEPTGQEPPAVAGQEPQAAQGPARAEVPGGPGAPVREEIPGGFRLGPFDESGSAWWLSPDAVWVYAKAGGEARYGAVSLAGGGLEPGPGHDPEDLPYWDRWHLLLSPDAGRAVVYSFHGFDRTFVDRETGAVSEPQAPNFGGSHMFDSWSPDGSRFLVQSVRTDPVPGFYFLDRDGNPAGTFAEPGYYSHRGVWSPDGKRLAFLSVPADVFYPRIPEEWEEPPYGERVGVLDPETGRVTYFAIDGLTFYAHPVWSPDGERLAVVCGERTTVRLDGPWEGYETTRLRGPRPCLIDPEEGTIAPMGDPAEGDVTIVILGLADEAALVAWARPSDGAGYGWVPLGGGALVDLSGTWSVEGAQLVAGGRAALTGQLLPNKLVLFNQRGEVERILAEGAIQGLTASPDGRHVAFFDGGYLTVLRVPEE